MEKVSVIIPVHNSAEHLKECIDSVINQSYKNIEIIVVNDCSTDESLEIIKSYKKVICINLKKKSGAAHARNVGIKKATGSYLCFLDADDFWVKDKIKIQMDFIKKNNYEFIYSNYIYLRNNKKHIAKVPNKLTYNQALKNTAIFTSTVMLNLNILNKKDILMPNIEKGHDTATWWKILKKGYIAYGINKELTYYRVGNKSLSHNKLKALKRTWNIYKFENLNIFKRIWCFISYIINAILRRLI